MPEMRWLFYTPMSLGSEKANQRTVKHSKCPRLAGRVITSIISSNCCVTVYKYCLWLMFVVMFGIMCWTCCLLTHSRHLCCVCCCILTLRFWVCLIISYVLLYSVFVNNCTFSTCSVSVMIILFSLSWCNNTVKKWLHVRCALMTCTLTIVICVVISWPFMSLLTCKQNVWIVVSEFM